MSGRIYYYCQAAHRYTLNGWFDVIGTEPDSPQVVVRSYESLTDLETPQAGTHVFTDTERIESSEMSRAVALARRIAAAGKGFAVANWPNRVRNRYELLQTLHAGGHNGFRCFRFEDRPTDMRFPVFLRIDRRHDGPATPLLHDARALRRAVAELLLDEGARREDLLIVEYVDTDRIDGRFVKYSAYCAFGEIYPANLAFATEWRAKGPFRVIDDATYASEIAYARDNPHAGELRRVFELAQTDYGRVDYGLRDGRIEVFEINTNPTLLSRSIWEDPDRRRRFLVPWGLPALRATFRRLAAASLDPARAPRLPVSVRRRVEALHRCLGDADAGVAAQQFQAGLAYRRAWWLPHDLVQAYKWFTLAARSANASEAVRNEAILARERIAAEMSEERIAEAERVVLRWSVAGERSLPDAAVPT